MQESLSPGRCLEAKESPGAKGLAAETGGCGSPSKSVFCLPTPDTLGDAGGETRAGSLFSHAFVSEGFAPRLFIQA